MSNIQAILPYKSSSKSAKLLASALNVKRIKTEGSRFRHKPNKFVINWGSPRFHPRTNPYKTLNKDWAVAQAGNKHATLARLSEAEIPTITWTTHKRLAQDMLDNGDKVYVRHLLNSSCGRGIQIVEPGEELPDAPLYTKHFKKKKEYRVHVGRGSVIHVQQKRKRHGFESTTSGIRNYENGWIFACNDVEPLSEEQLSIAIRGVAALGLDFGAVDLLVDREGQSVICEINTAPGIEGTTLSKYVAFFQGL
jgi:glutathione synthase/RimK-type ligase-like ATP-grasp enzyme